MIVFGDVSSTFGDVFSAFAAGRIPSFLKPGYGHSVRNGGRLPGETR